MTRNSWLLATLSDDAPALAEAFHLGLEIDAFCVADNMDGGFLHWDGVVRAQIRRAPARVLHAPFAEMFPCAIDPRARALCMDRMMRAAEIARSYGIRRMVAHSGYLPHIYYPEWFESQSAAFWCDFLKTQPENFEILIENVLDEDPESLLRMIAAIDDPRAAFCLDVGHAHAASPCAPLEWIETLHPFLRHVHLHNNYGAFDEHNSPDRGTIPMDSFLARLDALAPQASITLECPDARAAVDWLRASDRI